MSILLITPVRDHDETHEFYLLPDDHYALALFEKLTTEEPLTEPEFRLANRLLGIVEGRDGELRDDRILEGEVRPSRVLFARNWSRDIRICGYDGARRWCCNRAHGHDGDHAKGWE